MTLISNMAISSVYGPSLVRRWWWRLKNVNSIWRKRYWRVNKSWPRRMVVLIKGKNKNRLELFLFWSLSRQKILINVVFCYFRIGLLMKEEKNSQRDNFLAIHCHNIFGWSSHRLKTWLKHFRPYRTHHTHTHTHIHPHLHSPHTTRTPSHTTCTHIHAHTFHWLLFQGNLSLRNRSMPLSLIRLIKSLFINDLQGYSCCSRFFKWV